MKQLIRTTPEVLGIPSAALLKLLRRLEKMEYINSFMLLRHGKVCLEAWLKPYKATVPHQLFSLSKSFTSCAIGLAQQEGLLNIHDRLIKYFPQYENVVTDSRMRQVTLQDLLTMRSGHLSCPTPYFWDQTDWRKVFLSSKLGAEPGTHFTYNSGASYMLAAVIRQVTSCNVREYLMPRLFAPLGIAPGIWENCPHGINCGGWGLYLTTEDIAKFAQLLLQNGRWHDRQLLPADYLAEAVSKQADNSANTLPDWQVGYGYQFWRSRHGYRGDGAAGQYAVMLPESDVAIAVTSCTGNMQIILDAIWEELLPELHDDALPEAPEAWNELQQLAKNMSLPTVVGDITRRSENQTWLFAENPQGIKSCQLEFGENDCTLTFDGPNGIEQLRAGFGYFAESLFQLTDLSAHPTAASAAWKNDHTLEIHTFITDGIYRDIWQIDLADAVEPLKNTMLCACFRPLRPRFICKVTA